MKRFFRLSAFILMLLFSLFLPRLNVYSETSLFDTDSEPEISMDFQDASLRDVLKVLSIQSGLNFIASELVQDRKITLYLVKVPLKKAVDKLFKANNLSYELDRDSNILIVKDWGKLQVDTQTRIFYLKYATVTTSSLKEEMGNFLGTGGNSAEAGSSSGGGSGKWKQEENSGITKAVEKLLSSVGSLIEDYRTNSLVVTDTPNRLEVIAMVIASLDVPVPQVMLEVEMLDVSKNAVDKMGVNWPTSILGLDFTAAKRMTKFPFGSKSQDPQQWSIELEDKTPSGFTFDAWRASHFGPTILSVIDAELTLDFLKTQTDTKFLARPRLLTLNNETAEIRIATNEAIGITTTTSSAGGATGSTTASAERAETGVVLRVTPQINMETGEVTMFIYPKVSEAIQSSTFLSDAKENTFVNPEERSTKSLVKVKDGETVVIGGLIRDEFSRVATKVPILGDLPIIGALFRHTGGANDKNKQRELLVFITPHIIKDSNIQLAQTKNAAILEREQSAAQALSRELEINSSLNSLDKNN
jgi:type IV pilus assembly protein PilQ